MQPFYSIILPAYNEEQTIERAIQEVVRVFAVLGKAFEILVVDDGSKDQTALITKRLQPTIPELQLIRHKQNQGKGAAVKTGVRTARGDFFLFLDCDLSTQPEEFKKCIPFLKTHDVVIGSRRVKGAHIVDPQPWYRSFLGRCFNFLVRSYLHLPYHDTQCGFKVFSKKTKPLFNQMESKGWAFDVELLVRARQSGFLIKEIPVEWRNGRESRVRLMEMWKIWEELMRIKKQVNLLRCSSTHSEHGEFIEP